MIKRLVLFLLLCPTLCFGDAGLIGEESLVVATGSCTTSNDSVIESETTGGDSVDIGSAVWAAQQFIIDATTTITGVMIKVNDLGAADSLHVEIWTNSSDTPGALITNLDKTIAHGDIAGGSLVEVFFEFDTPIEKTADTYYIVVWTENSGSFKIERASTSQIPEIYNYSTDQGSTWPTLTREMWFEVWGCQ